MTNLSPRQLERIIQRFGKGVAGLTNELKAKFAPGSDRDELIAKLASGWDRMSFEGRLATKDANVSAAEEFTLTDLTRAGDQTPQEVVERIVAVSAGARPVARIRDNKATTEFIGPDSESWARVIQESAAYLNRAIPAVGRIELTNGDISWAGTGWLIAPDILVTNRHVAQDFARRDPSSSRYVFRLGLLNRVISCDIDFREEELRNDELEHPITSVLWIADSDEPDVAFLRVRRGPGQPPLPTPIELAESVATEATVAAIGYPAKDPSIPDQRLVHAIFGDVYDRKRLAPGRLGKVGEVRIEHDCSTLGGNSGSVLLDLTTGKAVGLHHGGYLDDTANLAVSAVYLRKLLNRVQSDILRAPPKAPAQPGTPAVESTATPPGSVGAVTMRFNIPIEITVRIGASGTCPTGLEQSAPLSQGEKPSLDQVLHIAERDFGSNPDVLRIRPGYRFKNGWITDERVVVIEVRQKLPYGVVSQTGKEPFPRELLGIGIDVRTAPLRDQLDELGIDLTVLERRARPAGYTEPPGYDDPDSDVALKPVKARMHAIFHVSPDSGFPNLRDFLGRVERHVTATMYEWTPNHISDALEAAIRPEGNTLKMVTQKRGVGESDATESAVEDMKARLGSKFQHVWASVRGPQRLIQNSYHIKVASRDGKEFWLSSGNWKESNQADIDPAGEDSDDPGSLSRYNREWHAIIAHEGLAKLFQKYIEFDFDQATRFPLEDGEAVRIPDIEFFMPIEAFAINPERRRRGVEYADPLILGPDDGELEILPLLTPDRDADGQRIFMRTAIEMIRRATHRILVQNQSFNMTGDDNDELVEFLTVLKDKQREIRDVRIIFRDARDFGRRSDIVRQEELIERLKEFGLNVSPDHLRLQPKCHTKGIIVDSREVMLGSHNLTNQGALFNRDASLLVRSPRVAAYFEKIFLFDWDVLARSEADERVGGIRRAAPNEDPPPGFRRVSLSELLGED